MVENEVILKRAKRSRLTPGVQNYHFLSRKYGIELLADVGRIESLPNFITDDTPHQLSFYEIAIDDLLLYRFQFFHQYSRPTSFEMTGGQLAEAAALVQTIEREYQHLQNDSGHLIRAILYQLLVVLNRYYANSYQIQADTFVHPNFFRFRSQLENDFKINHRVVDYVQKLKTSAVHLNKVCKQHSGFSAQQMIHHKLISEIKRQLQNNRPVKEIVYEFNFSDPSNFNRFFKNQTGTTAQQYRDAL